MSILSQSPDSVSKIDIEQECRVVEAMSKYCPIVSYIGTHEQGDDEGFSNLDDYVYGKDNNLNRGEEQVEIDLFKANEFLSMMTYKLE